MTLTSYQSDYYNERPDYQFIADTVQTARKDYTCDMCKGVISKGTRYRRHICKSDGEFECWHLHLNHSSVLADVPF